MYFDCNSMSIKHFQSDIWVSELKSNKSLINSIGYTKIDVRKMYYGSLDPSGSIVVKGHRQGVITTIINLPNNSGAEASADISSYSFLIYDGHYDGSGPMYYDFKLS